MVVHERSSQRDLPARVAGGRSDCRKIAREHRSRRYELSRIPRILAERGALISAEEKKFVFHHRTTDRAAKLIALQRAPFSGEIIPCIKKIIADKFEEISMELICTGFRNRAYL